MFAKMEDAFTHINNELNGFSNVSNS
jgi:hypothetical protein